MYREVEEGGEAEKGKILEGLLLRLIDMGIRNYTLLVLTVILESVQ